MKLTRRILTPKCLLYCFVFIFTAHLLYHKVLKQQGSSLSLKSNNEPAVNQVNPGNKPSLTFKARQFFLDGQPLQILSGAVHYFRVPQEYWRDRLLKLKAAGLNTVETYAPWNLHEEHRGKISFKGMLDVRKFFQLARELGLYVIFRPGPYICSEWEFGGLPGWLLADPNMRVRSMYEPYTRAVEDYLKIMLNEVADLQHCRGGPIIAFQLENEYGNYGDDARYLQFIGDTMRRYGAVEAFFTSDGNDGIAHARHLPGAFAGVNYNKLSDGKKLISIVKSWHADLPVFATELWTGWFLGWGAQKDEAIGTEPLVQGLRFLLQQGASINLYMLHGGTNFGFMNGFNGMDGEALITSYDYGAPLNEQGSVTAKYEAIRALLLSQLTSEKVQSLPSVPAPIPTKEYGSRAIKWMMQWDSLTDLVENPIHSDRIKFMEEVGQNFGFILYRSSFKSANTVVINGVVADRAVVLVNSAPLDPANPLAGVAHHPRPQHAPPSTRLSLASASLRPAGNTLDILVENLGRVNYAPYQSDMFNTQRKGIASIPETDLPGASALQTPGSVSVDDTPLRSFKILSLDFGQSYLAKVSVSKDSWKEFQPQRSASAPALYRTVLDISSDETPKDTFVDMSGWTKGVVFVNGFNLGRYWNIGPQVRLYLPAPVLRAGANEVLIFELHQPATTVSFEKAPKLMFPAS